jgi:hypothetical protein
LRVLDIPFVAPGEVAVLVETNGHTVLRTFEERKDALSFVVDEAMRSHRSGEEVVFSIEGADGVWRSLDPKFTPPA